MYFYNIFFKKYYKSTRFILNLGDGLKGKEVLYINSLMASPPYFTEDPTIEPIRCDGYLYIPFRYNHVFKNDCLDFAEFIANGRKTTHDYNKCYLREKQSQKTIGLSDHSNIDIAIKYGNQNLDNIKGGDSIGSFTTSQHPADEDIVFYHVAYVFTKDRLKLPNGLHLETIITIEADTTDPHRTTPVFDVYLIKPLPLLIKNIYDDLDFLKTFPQGY